MLFVRLYWLSFKWFRAYWKRWLFWTFLIALPMGILSVLSLVLGLLFFCSETIKPSLPNSCNMPVCTCCNVDANSLFGEIHADASRSYHCGLKQSRNRRLSAKFSP